MDFIVFPDVHRRDFEALGLGVASDYDVIDLVSSDEEVVEKEPTMALSAEEEEGVSISPLEDEEEEVPMPPLEVEEEQHVYVGPTVGNEMQQGEDVHVPHPEVRVDPSSGQRKGIGEEGVDAPTLRRVFSRSHLTRPRVGTLPRFAPFVGPSDPFVHDRELNHHSRMDLDVICFYMLTRDLIELFGIMARLANRRVKIRDLVELSDWLHMVSNPIVVRVYAGSDRAERDRFKADLVEMLRVPLGLTLTCSNDSQTLWRNHVNVSVCAMSQALYALGARICRVSFLGMKLRLTEAEAEPILDRFIYMYRVDGSFYACAE